MFRNRLYYAIKPLLPWSVRIGMRRMFARRKRARVTDVWPIAPGSEQPPPGWPGWPDGKTFAFVLTHDVEGPEGLAKVRQLAELEMSLGFRSCFNFIPEGPYRVPKELLAWLNANGFEVGVHDLKHDGQLFRSRQDFARHAARINAHLRDWRATGFRAGFMLHQLDWLHDLNIQYDCSTFDTDPFEPQPHGQNTIFPFWMPQKQKAESRKQKAGDQEQKAVLRSEHLDSPSQNISVSAFQCLNEGVSAFQCLNEGVSASSQNVSVSAFQRLGYVELPYTLPQDSTLFLLLREKTPEIWLRKLDWIAQHGGMALVNVHPDYIRFEGEPASPRTYPVEHYVALLRHVRSCVPGSKLDAPSPSEVPLSAPQDPSISECQDSSISAFQNVSISAFQDSSPFWQPLPRQVADLVAPLQLPPRRRPRRICMVTHSFYKSDARVTRYAEALADRGDQVDVIALRPSTDVPAQEKVGNVNLFSLQTRAGKKEKSRLGYLFPILRFLVASSLWVARRHARERYDLLHIHNVPDFLVFAGWFPKFKGARIILDIHDIVPEFYASKFSLSPSSVSVRLLKWIERAAAHFADHVIIANHLWHETYAARTRAGGKCSVFINNVDSAIFHPRPRTRPDGKLQVIFPGGLQWHQGLDIAIRAFQKVVSRIPHAEFHIYGDGNMKSAWTALAAELGLSDQVRFFAPLPVRQIAQLMADADLGVVPKRADSFGNEAYSTKIMEFMSLGVPVVVSSTRIDRFYFDDSIVRFFPSGDVDALAGAMIELLADPGRREQLAACGLAYVARSNWDSRRGAYLQLVDALIAGQQGDLKLPPDPSVNGERLNAEEPAARPGEMVLN